MEHLFAAVSQQEAAVYIGALMAFTTTILAYLLRDRKTKSAIPPLLYDASTTQTGATPVEMWLQRFERIEQRQLWTMVVLVGQGAAFMLYCFIERADRKADGHRLNDRMDLIQMALERQNRR